MKTLGICAILALAAMSAAPVMAAGPALDKAVALAAQSSGARLSDICYAVYKAVKEAPEEADVIFSQVISQRTNWTSGEVYAIFRAVLLARPDLEEEFRTQAASYKGSEGTMEGKDSYSGDAAKNPMGYKLLTALHEAGLPEGIVPAVMNALQNNAIDLTQVNADVVEGRSGSAAGAASSVVASATISEVKPSGSDKVELPTPPAMSPQN